MAVLLSVRNLSKTFGVRTLFEGIQFSLHKGERIGLIGPNGAGKSTLLKSLIHEDTLDTGEVIRNQSIRISLLEQDPQFEPSKGILETIIEAAQDAEDPTAVAMEIFRKVGLHELDSPSSTPVGELSGGWQKRVYIACTLAKRPDLLLLDEPTNHLDIESILWLENFLSRSQLTLITVTHDRAFLQRISNRILELDRRNPGGLLSVDGNYETYLQRKQELLENQQKQETTLRNRLRRETEWLKRGAKARTTKQKARIQRAGELGEQVEVLRNRNQSAKVRLQFGNTHRQSKRLIEAKDISKSFDGELLFQKLNIFLGPGSRLGLLGRNGTGKTTLIRSLVKEAPLDSGSVFHAEDLSVAYFEQKRESLDLDSTVKTVLCPSGDQVEFQGKFVHVQTYLSRFLFSGEQADQPVSRLSGGEKSRLLIARLMLRPADVLILDEPTNDLDMATLDVLEECLEQFKGAVVLVSHDRYFLDRVSNQILAFTGNGETLEFADILQWESWVSEKRESETTKAKREARVRKKTKLSYKEEKELNSMEVRIQESENRLTELNRQSQLPENVSNGKKLTELSQEMAQLQKDIENLFERWQQLENLQNSYKRDK